MELTLGFVLGCVLASGLWAMLQAFSKNERRFTKQRRTAMQEISAECAEIDGKVSGQALTGSSAADARALPARIDNVKKMLAINMPFFDVYFVKYIEALLARYEEAVSPVSLAESAMKEKKSGEGSAAAIAGGPTKAGNSIPINFDQTWQFDFSKEHGRLVAETQESPLFEEKLSAPEKPPSTEILVKKEDIAVIPEQPEKSVAAPDQIQKPVAHPKTPEAAPEKKKADIKEEIAATFDIGRVRESKSKPIVTQSTAEKKEAAGREDGESPDVEILLAQEKTAAPQAAAAITAGKDHPEDFISSDDLIDKIDTFFGIKE